MRALNLAMILTLSFGFCTHAQAYGTVHALGQDAEHERITRRALACDPAASTINCFQAKTLDELAGKKGTFGGVGFADIPTKKLVGQASAHCDGGDYLDVPDYGRNKEGDVITSGEARAIIIECRDWMEENFNAAISAAADMLDANGNLHTGQTEISKKCIRNPKKKNSAKCRTLTHIGIMLHAVQDFYSHSNWTDIADTASTTSPDNPPGLSKNAPAPWLHMPNSTDPFPDGLITGCYEGVFESRNCKYKDAAGQRHHRVKHMFLNKDKGVVDPDADNDATEYPGIGLIGPGKAGRGAINNNFERSVSAAVLDTRSKLAEFKRVLELQHGDEKATLMFCALTRDAPLVDCKSVPTSAF